MNAPSIATRASALTWCDAVGTQHPVCDAECRIVSLVPSLTELLCELGLSAQLVGRTRYCIHPRATLKTIASVGGTKDVSLEKVRALKPTHVIVNIDENLRDSASALAEFVPQVIVTHPSQPEDNLALYQLFGGIFKRGEAAESLSTRYLAKLLEVRARRPRVSRRVLYLIWRAPWMSVARETYIAQTLAEFNLLTEPARSVSRYPEVRLADYRGQVDHVLLSSEPYPFRARHVAEVQAALPRAHVQLIDGEMTSWYGSRALPALDYLDDFTRALEVA